MAPQHLTVNCTTNNIQQRRFIRNGNIQKPVKIGENVVSVKNTCGIDSLLEIFAHVMGNDERLNNLINAQKDNEFFKLCINHFEKKANFYQERAKFLKDHFPKSTLWTGITLVECACTVKELLDICISKISLMPNVHNECHQIVKTSALDGQLDVSTTTLTGTFYLLSKIK